MPRRKNLLKFESLRRFWLEKLCDHSGKKTHNSAFFAKICFKLLGTSHLDLLTDKAHKQCMKKGCFFVRYIYAKNRFK